MKALYLAAAAMALAMPASLPAHAANQVNQGDQGNGQQAGDGQNGNHVAQACLNKVNGFVNRMENDGYWPAGWGGYPFAAVPPRPATGAANGTNAAATNNTGGANSTAGANNNAVANNTNNSNNNIGNNGVKGIASNSAAARNTIASSNGPVANSGTAAAPVGVGPWGGVNWVGRPAYDIRSLTRSAEVLGQRGDQQGCQNVLNQAESEYNRYAADLKARGVNPGNVSNWRQRQIAQAKPLSQVSFNAMRVDRLTGTDVRNQKDQVLGSVDDVVFDPQTGKVAYLVIARGGWAGIGTDYVAVPWQDFRATPGMSTLVLDTTQQAMNNAPKIDPDNWFVPSRYRQVSQNVNQYWQGKVNQQQANNGG